MFELLAFLIVFLVVAGIFVGTIALIGTFIGFAIKLIILPFKLIFLPIIALVILIKIAVFGALALAALTVIVPLVLIGAVILAPFLLIGAIAG